MTFLQNVDWQNLMSPESLWAILRVAIFAVAGLLLLRIVVVVVRRLLKRKTTAQVAMLVTKGINYVGIGVIVTLVLVELGVNLAPILGAAGIVGLAVGIASQASLSNIISGLFLVSEKPFEIGDVVKTGETTGIVESIDLLSVKIRTFDNLFIRVPNERLASNQLTNITRYPIRRLDFKITLPFNVELSRVQDLLSQIATQEPLCLAEPAPLVLFTDFSDSGFQVLFGVWFQKSDFLLVKNKISGAILSRFDAEGIRFPAGVRTIQGTDRPISLQIVSPEVPKEGPDL